MKSKQMFWIHRASFTYRVDKPEKLIETIWVQRPGWGYIRRRDLWTERECSLQEILAQGYVLQSADPDDDVRRCPFCGMYVAGIPGYLVHKHLSECGGSTENWQRIEETLISAQRMKKYEQKIMEERLRELAEQEEMEKRERFDRIKEDMAVRQQQKDRKRRLREETKEEWKRR